MTNLEKRLAALESTIPAPAKPDIERTDEEEADRTGAWLWLEPHRRIWPGIRPTYAAALHAWNEAVARAQADGLTEYHERLRPYAMAVWLEMKPSILEHRRRFGHWVRDEPEPERPTMEEFRQLPLAEKMRLLRSETGRRGHWSKCS